MLKRLRKAHPILFCVLAEVVFLASLFVTDLVFTIALVLFRADFASIDVSFISLTKVLPAVLGVMKEDGQLVCLIKPQFEAGREKVGKNGVVKDIAVHKEVILMIADYAMANGLGVMGLDFSPIKGPKGNIEYLIYLDKKQPGATKEEVHTWVEEIAAKSHEVL